MSGSKSAEDVFVEIVFDVVKEVFYLLWGILSFIVSFTVKALKKSPEEKMRQTSNTPQWGQKTNQVACPQCGAQIESGASRCYACGSRF